MEEFNNKQLLWDRNTYTCPNCGGKYFEHISTKKSKVLVKDSGRIAVQDILEVSEPKTVKCLGCYKTFDMPK